MADDELMTIGRFAALSGLSIEEIQRVLADPDAPAAVKDPSGNWIWLYQG